MLIATLWAGSLWGVGYLAVPTLFATLHDRVLAGTIAASLFSVQAWLSVCCALLLLGLMIAAAHNFEPKERRSLLLVVIVMLGCAVVVHFGLQPFMAELRHAGGASGVMASDVQMKFSLLHGISSMIYLVQSLMAAVLIIKIR